jgi:hypothetical protein
MMGIIEVIEMVEYVGDMVQVKCSEDEELKRILRVCWSELKEFERGIEERRGDEVDYCWWT